MMLEVFLKFTNMKINCRNMLEIIFLFMQCSIYQFTGMVLRVAVVTLWTEKTFKSRDEPFKLAYWEERDTISVKWFYLEKNRTLKLGKRDTAPLYSLSQSTAKNNVWYYQQVLLWFSVGGKCNRSIGNSANKLMAIFKCCNGNARAIKERSVKHIHNGKDPNT